MAQIQFKGKVRRMVNMDGSLAWEYIPVPVFRSIHADMQAFRVHPKFGFIANSDLFPGVLAKIKADKFPNGNLRMDRVPEGVTVDRSGFLAVVTVEV